MSSNFFIRNSKFNGKRKLKSSTQVKTKHAKKLESKTKFTDKARPSSMDSDEITSDEDSVTNHVEEESDEDLVSAQDKKIGLAKKYLEEIEKEEKERLETADVQGSVINRLRENILDEAGKLTKKVADQILKPERNEDIFVMRCKEHKLSITCVVVSPDNKFVYSSSKDAIIVKWSIPDRIRVGIILSKHKQKDENCKIYSHNSSILSLAVSFDGKYLASSDESSAIQIWDSNSLTHLHSFKGHRSSVTGLAFCPESNILYSSSRDRSVRVWSLDEMSFVETLFGHQCDVTDVDILKKDRAVTSGGSDNTIRVWKVQEESQLIFNGHQRSIDKVKRVDQQHFVSCGDDGSICVWGILKKKPLCIIPTAHGVDSSNNEPNWITSISSLPNSDLLVSGSCDGNLKFWKCEDSFRNVSLLFDIPVLGYINDISFSKDGSHLIVGVGQEHKLGRWFCEKRAKNSILILQLRRKVPCNM